MAKDKPVTPMELIMIIVILVILGVAIIPRYIDWERKAKQAAEKAIVNSVRAGISTFYAQQCLAGRCAYPGVLDGASGRDACTKDDPCFENVLAQDKVTNGSWSKDSRGNYIGPAGNKYRYSGPAKGSFLRVPKF